MSSQLSLMPKGACRFSLATRRNRSSSRASSSAKRTTLTYYTTLRRRATVSSTSSTHSPPRAWSTPRQSWPSHARRQRTIVRSLQCWHTSPRRHPVRYATTLSVLVRTASTGQHAANSSASHVTTSGPRGAPGTRACNATSTTPSGSTRTGSASLSAAVGCTPSMPPISFTTSTKPVKPSRTSSRLSSTTSSLFPVCSQTS